MDQAVAPLLDADGFLYVFGYGSLIWKPGFPHVAMLPALLRGFHRRFCIWSTHHRGTAERPGLVLGLDRGGACRGVLFRVEAAAAADALAYLDAREMIGGVYARRVVTARLLPAEGEGGGAAKRAVTFVAVRGLDSYCRALAPEVAASTIAAGVGLSGANRDYLLNTVAELRRLGVRDAGLDRIAALLPPG